MNSQNKCNIENKKYKELAYVRILPKIYFGDNFSVRFDTILDMEKRKKNEFKKSNLYEEL